MLAIYTRLSREDDDSNSIENQLREAKEFAESKGFTEYQIYNEGEGISGGAELFERPQLTQLIEDMVSGKITAVHARKQERLERNTMTWGKFLKTVFDNKIKVYYSGVLQDLDTPEGKMLANIMSSFNSYTIDKQSHLTKKALKDNAREGKAHGMLPYGYGKDDNGYLTINENEAEIVKEIFKLSLEGIGTNSIAHKLQERGVPTRYNSIGKGTIAHRHKDTGAITKQAKKDVKWAGNTIRGILKNPMYKGIRVFGGVEYECPSIMDSFYWDKVNKNLANNANNSGKKVEHKYLLKGLLRCGRCGRNMYGRVNKRDNFYMCSSKRIKGENCGNRSINIYAIEEYIWGRLFLEKEVQTALGNHLKDNGTQESIGKIEKQLEILEKEKSQLDKDKKRAVQLAIKGFIEEKDIKGEIKRIERGINDVKLKIDKESEQLQQYKNIKEKNNNLEKDLTNLEGVNFKDKKEIINKYIKEITVLYAEPIYMLTIDYAILNINEAHILNKTYSVGLNISANSVYRLQEGVDAEKESNKLNKILRNTVKEDLGGLEKK